MEIPKSIIGKFWSIIDSSLMKILIVDHLVDSQLSYIKK